MSKSNLNSTSLEFTNAGTRKVLLTSGTNSLDFEGDASSDVNLTGVHNATIGNNVIFNDKQLVPNTKSITLGAPSVITGSSYSLTLPPTQGTTNSYLKNNGGGSLTWDTIPITSFSYRFVRATANQTTIGSFVTFEGTSTSEGTLAFSGGVFTLGAGKTYYLQGTVDQVTSSSSFIFNYRWYDVTNSAYIGVAGSVIEPSSASSSKNDIAYAVVSPSTSINVQLQIVSSINVTSINASSTGGPAALVYEIITGTGTIGDVVGPASSVDNSIVRFDGTSGKIIQNSNVLLTDTDDIQGASTLQLKQSVNTVTLTPGTNTLTLSGNSGGKVALSGIFNASLSGSLILAETTAGINTITLSAPGAITSSYSLLFPVAQGGAGTYLKNDGSGALTWSAITGTGDVSGPASSTDNAITRYDGTTGKTVQNSVVTLSDTGDLAGVITLALKGTTDSVTIQPSAATAAYTLTLPAAQGAVDTFLRNDGTGVLTWATTGSGSVSGPVSSTDNALVRFDGTTGKTIQNSTVTLADTGAMSGLVSISMTDSGTNTIELKPAATVSASYTLTLPAAQSTASKTSALYNDGTGALSWQTDPVSFTGTAPVSYLIPVFADSTGRRIKRIIGSLSLSDTDNIQNIAELQFNKDNIYIGTDPVRTDIIKVGSTVDPSLAVSIDGLKNVYFNGSLVLGVQPGFRGTAYPINFPNSSGTLGDILYLSNASTGQLSWTSGAGNAVIGPASATDTALVRYDGTTGKLVQNSVVTVSNNGDMVGVKTIGLSGSSSGILTLQPAATVTNYSISLPGSQGSSGQVMINDGFGNLSWADRSNVNGVAVYGYYNSLGSWDASRRMTLDPTPVLNTDVTQIFVATNILVLNPGTWEITAVWQGTQSSGVSTIQFYDETLGNFVGNSCVTAAANSTSSYNPSNILVYSVTLVANGLYSVRDTGSGNLQPSSGNSYLYVRKLSETLYNPAPTTEYLMGSLTADITTNLAAGDHIKFNSLSKGQSSNGTTDTGNIILDTTTAYVTTANVASLGRITLKAGRTYELTGYAQGVATVGTATFTYAWYNADSSLIIGTTSTYYPNQLSGTVTVGDIGSGSSGSIPFTGNILTATKTNGSIGGAASTIVVTFPNMGVVPNATVMPMDAGGSPSTQDNDAGYPVISTISATGLTFWVEDSTSVTQNMLYAIILTAPTNGGMRPNGPSKAIYRPLTDTRVELRILSGAMVTNYASDTYAEVVMLIGDPNTLPFNGATASVAGTQGLVPVPAAGQQNNFLRGDATWSNATSNSSGSSVANAVTRFDGTSGNYVKNSGVTLSDTQDLAGILTLGISGSTFGSVTIQAVPSVTTYSMTLPPEQGSTGSVLTNNGSGTLTWSSPTTGDVFGPSSATSNALARFDSSTGKLIKSSLVVLSDTGDTTGFRSIGMAGTSSGTLTIRPAAATSSYTVIMPPGQGVAGTVLTNDGSGTLAWTTTGTGSGDVVGPLSSSDNAVARYDGVTGKLIQNSSLTISDTGDLGGVRTLGLEGATSGILTLTSSPVTTSYSLTMPAAQGSSGTFLRNNGTGTLTWDIGTSGNLLNIQTFVSSAGTFTYTPTTGTKRAMVYVIGGGGAGGGAPSGTNKSAGCGGTGGGCQVGLFAIDPSLTGTVVVGAGGTGVSGAAGNAGAESTFTFSGSTITGTGGAGGTTAQSAGLSYIVQPNIVAGSATAINAVLLNTYTVYGSLGARGEIYNVNNTLVTGAGGNSAFGGGANVNAINAISTSGNGQAGTNGVGGGGSGGYQTNTTARTGGAGGFGGVYVFEYTDIYGGAGGDVDGPLVATDNALARYDGVSGKLIQNSGVLLSDTQDLSGLKTLAMLGSTSGTLTLQPAAAVTDYTLTMPAAQGAVDTFLKNDGSGVLSWSTSVGGDVTGPASSTNNAIARYDLATGKLLKNSTVTVSDIGAIAGAASLQLLGSTSGATVIQAAPTVTNYTVVMPNTQGGVGQLLANDGSGNLSWVNQSSTGIAVYSYYNCSGNWDASRRMNLNATAVINTSPTLMSVAGNILTLQSGTWELTAVWQGAQNAGGSTFQWYNEGSASFVGNQCQTPAINSVSTASSGNILVYSVVIASSATFSVRDTGGGNLQPAANFSYVYAKKLTDTPYNPAPTTEYLMGSLTADITTNLAAGDHIKFNGLFNSQSSNGTTNTGNISLDTTTAYVTTANVASLGRITLKAGRAYELTGYAQGVATVSAATFTCAWYNSDSNTVIGTTSTYYPNQLSGTVVIGDIGGGTSGSVTCTGNILTATKTNGSIGASASTIVVTFPNMGAVPQATITLKDAGGSPNTQDNDVYQPVISTASATSLTFWIEETSGTQNIAVDITLTTNTATGIRINGPSKAIYAPLADTRVELRIVSGSMIRNYASDTYAEVVMLIGAPNTLPFTGATASSAGSQGLVPVPTAGQQTRFLRGDSTWQIVPHNSSGTSVDNTLVRFDGTTGSTLQGSVAVLSDTGNLTGLQSVGLSGTTSGTLTIQPSSSTTNYTITFPSSQGAANSVLVNNGLGTLTWNSLYVRGSGGVTTNTVPIYNGTSGILLGSSPVTISSLGEIGATRSLTFAGSSSGTLSLTVPSAVTTYSLTLPSGQGAANTFLSNNGAGVLSWVAGSTITGPGSSTDTALVRWSGATGKIIQDSGILVNSVNAMTGVTSLSLKGSTNSVTIVPAAATAAYTMTLPAAQGAVSTVLTNDGAGVLTWSTTGNVFGPASATDSALARYDLTTGKILKNSILVATDAGSLSGVRSLVMSGATSGTLTLQPAATTINYALTMPSAQGSTNTYLRNDGSGGLTWAVGGNVSGPGSATNNALVRWDTASGSLIKNSGVTLSDTLDLVGPKTLGLVGATSGTLTLQTAAATVSYTLTLPSAQGAAGTVPTNDGSGALTWSTPGDVTGPATATDNAVARYDLATGKVLQNSVVTISDVGEISQVRSVTLAGATSGTLGINPSTTTTSYNVTMPSAQGSANTYLRNDGSGNLTWATAGTITGPGSSTDNALVRWDGVTGTALANSGVTLSATQDLGGVRTFAMNGSTSGTLTLQAAATTTTYTLTMPSGQGSAGTVLTNNGSGTLSWGAGGGGGGGSTDYMVGNLSATVFSNVSVGDHAQFNQAYQSSNGTATTTNITLDTTSPYSSGTNTASVGRITLKANLTYTIMGIIKSLAGVDYYGYSWYNSDTDVRIGTRGEGFASTSQAASTSSNPSYCTLTPSVDTRIELRLTESSTGSITNWYSGSAGYGETMFSISVATAATSSVAFTGATASVAGTQGLVPAPAAGQQASFLRGDATWAAAGDVAGPVSSTDTALALYSGTTGKVIQNSVVTVSSGGAMAGVGSLAIKGTTNSVTISPDAATAAYPLTLPAAQGAANSVLQNNGAGVLSWAAMFGIRNVRTFSSSGTYTPTAGTNRALVYVTGGGGAGGGAVSGVNNSVGSGGNAGGTYVGFFVINEAQTGTITIGTAGTGVSGSDGGDGTSTTFLFPSTGTPNATIAGTGGRGGSFKPTGTTDDYVITPDPNLSGGSASGLNAVLLGGYQIFGSVGNQGFMIAADVGTSGNGGSSIYGGGASGVTRNQTNGGTSGRTANGFGSGGSGGIQTNNTSSVSGGSGSAGYVVIYEY